MPKPADPKTPVDPSKPLERRQQERFCREYIIDCNGTQAAIAAGYSKNSAATQATDLLQRPHIKGRVDFLTEKHMRKADIAVEDIVNELKKMAFGGLDDFGKVNDKGEFELDMTDCTRDQINTLQAYETERVEVNGGKGVAVKTKIKLADKTKNLELLGRYLKMFTDRIEVVDITDREERLLAARRRAREEMD